MRKISTWAKAHKWPARIILVLSLLLLNITGILTGYLLKELAVIVPGSVLLLTILLYVWAILSYPARSTRSRYAPGHYYNKQKTRILFLQEQLLYYLYVSVTTISLFLLLSCHCKQQQMHIHPIARAGLINLFGNSPLP